jgi:exopolyphosphatase/guanosine-5'-triphosphate,3'-diphosphate pyrophosphatase
MNHRTRLAAVDLGSNSFRLEIGRLDHGQYFRTEYLKETVRQGNGMDEDRNLTPDAIRRGVDCLARFGERLAGFKPAEVRAVATQTLREARNRDEFLAQGKKALGFPIEVISGREEARLIYQGVSQLLPNSVEKRLVIDIGGRSTELILGEGASPNLMESYRVGSVAWSARYFQDGQFSKKAFESAEIAAKAVLDECLTTYRRDLWQVAYGSAGTVGAVGDVLLAAGWPAGSVSREGLDWMLEQLLATGSADKLNLPGLKDDRAPIIGGGLAILRALFDLLQINTLELASGGLRHGLIGELMGDASQQMYLPEVSIQRLAARFGIDEAQALRVEKVACQLFDQLGAGLRNPPADEQNGLEKESLLRHRRKLAWAANLHEIGAQISHSDYHKHGAYILDNADVLGLSVNQLHRLSLLVLGHRGKLRKLELDQDDAVFMCQLMALRLAVILCHARRDPDIKGMALSRGNGQPGQAGQPRQFRLSCRAGWPGLYPQSAHLLNEETLAWQKTPWSLAVKWAANGS